MSLSYLFIENISLVNTYFYCQTNLLSYYITMDIVRVLVKQKNYQDEIGLVYMYSNNNIVICQKRILKGLVMVVVVLFLN